MHSISLLLLVFLHTTSTASGFWRPAPRSVAYTKLSVFGGFSSKAKGEPTTPGFVTAVEIGDLNATQLVGWLHSWGDKAQVDNSLMGDEFVFPFNSNAEENGVSITFKYIEAGEIVPVGVVDFSVKTNEGSSDGAIEIVRRDGQTKAFLGEDVVIRNMVDCLASESSPPEAPTAEATVVSTEELLSDWGSPTESTAAAESPPRAKASDTRYTAPWQVFLNDLGKKVEDRLSN